MPHAACRIPHAPSPNSFPLQHRHVLHHQLYGFAYAFFHEEDLAEAHIFEYGRLGMADGDLTKGIEYHDVEAGSGKLARQAALADRVVLDNQCVQPFATDMVSEQAPVVGIGIDNENA